MWTGAFSSDKLAGRGIPLLALPDVLRRGVMSDSLAWIRSDELEVEPEDEEYVGDTTSSFGPAMLWVVLGVWLAMAAAFWWDMGWNCSWWLLLLLALVAFMEVIMLGKGRVCAEKKSEFAWFVCWSCCCCCCCCNWASEANSFRCCLLFRLLLLCRKKIFSFQGVHNIHLITFVWPEL